MSAGDPATRHTKIVMLSAHVDDETVFDALRCGVSGFLLKDTPPEKFVEAVRTVAGGGSVLSPDLAAREITELAKRPTVNRTSGVGLKHLTEREGDVFKMLVCGYHNDEIAKMLFVAESTVKSHVQRLYHKLGVRDRVQVVIYAYEHGLIAMGQGASQRPASDRRPRRGDGGDIASAPGAAGLPGAPDHRQGVAVTAPRC
jgi:DNA-binding NarL/FixJ family response regulator